MYYSSIILYMGLAFVASAYTMQQYDIYMNYNTMSNILASHGYALLTLFSFMMIFQKLFFNENLDDDYERVKRVMDTYFNSDNEEDNDEEESEDDVETIEPQSMISPTNSPVDNTSTSDDTSDNTTDDTTDNTTDNTVDNDMEMY